MFRFSKDNFVASKQRQAADDLFINLIKKFSFEHSPEIEKWFDKHIKSYSLLEELPKLSIQFDHPIVMPVIVYNDREYFASQDLKRAYDKLNKPRSETIPYIEFSFPEDYECPHGDSFKHVFIFFFTQFPDFELAEFSVTYYLEKLDKLKVFL